MKKRIVEKEQWKIPVLIELSIESTMAGADVDSEDVTQYS